MEKTAVLLMAYGTPRSLDEVEPYYTDIRGGRKPTPENLNELIGRYQRIGGRTPLLEITLEQARALEQVLNSAGSQFKVYVGMKHWHPYIAETVERIRDDHPSRIVALVLAPHYSRFSTEGYRQRLDEALANTSPPEENGESPQLDVSFVQSWHNHPLFLKSIAERLLAARSGFGATTWEGLPVVFSAHSLPERILQSGDPYPRELLGTCEGVAPLVDLPREGWRFAYQSAGRTGEKWLGPDILETLDRIAGEGHKRVLVAPIGFCADHLEVLYDIDVECAEHARSLGLELRRIESPNATPAFISALAAIVREHLPG